jgi:hypothetical protein
MGDKKITYLETFVRYNHVYFLYDVKKKKKKRLPIMVVYVCTVGSVVRPYPNGKSGS